MAILIIEQCNDQIVHLVDKLRSLAAIGFSCLYLVKTMIKKNILNAETATSQKLYLGTYLLVLSLGTFLHTRKFLQ